MSYSAYIPMLTSAQKKPQFWRVLVGAGAVFILSAIVLTPIYLTVLGALSPVMRSIEFGPDSEIILGASRGGVLAVLSSFVFLFGGTLLVAKYLHQRSLTDLMGPLPVVRRDFWKVCAWVAAFLLVMVLLPSSESENDLTSQHTIPVWFMWLPLGMLGLMFQITAEEVFFRGYLQTQLIAATKSRALGMIIAALIFGAGHFPHSIDGLASFVPVVWATLFGLMAGDLTARTGSLGPAMAIHLLNNAMALLLAPVAGQLSGFGLWVREVELDTLYLNPMLLSIEFLSLLIMWLIARIALKR